MGNYNIGFWELAAAPYGPPAEDGCLSASSSSHFDPIVGSWLAQSFLRAVLPLVYIPPTSHRIASPCWPRVQLLRDARPRCTWGKFLLSDLCDDNGLHPDFEPQENEWQPYRFLALGYRDLREQRERNQEQMDAEYREWEQRGGNEESWNETEEHANFFNTRPVRVVTVVKNSCFDFSKKAIKQVSTISLMPAPDTIRLVSKRLNLTYLDFRETYGPQLDLPSAFSDTTASSCYSSEGSYVTNPFYHGDARGENHTFPVLEADCRFPTSAAPSFGTVADIDRPNWEYGLDKVVPMNVRGQGHLIPAPPIESSSETVSMVEEQDKASLLSITSSIEAAIQLVGNAEAWVDHLSLAPTGSYESRESVFDSEPSETAQPQCDAIDSNTGPLRTFFLDSEEDEDDEHVSNNDPEQTLCPPFQVIPNTPTTAADSTDACDTYEYITDNNSNNREGPAPATSPIITTAIDAAEHSLLSPISLPNIAPTVPNPETGQPTPSMSATDETRQECHPSLFTLGDRGSSDVSFDLRTPRRSAVRPLGLGAWILYGARKVARLVRRANCAAAAFSPPLLRLEGGGEKVDGRGL